MPTERVDRARVLFPDEKEQKSRGKRIPLKRQSHLTSPNALLEIFINTDERASTWVADDDALFIAAYPHFNVNGMVSDCNLVACCTLLIGMPKCAARDCRGEGPLLRHRRAGASLDFQRGAGQNPERVLPWAAVPKVEGGWSKVPPAC